MKTAYELAMERLNQTAPTTKLTGAQKKQLAELDSKYAAKIAESEIALQDEIAKSRRREIPKKSSCSSSNWSRSGKNFRPNWRRKRSRCGTWQNRRKETQSFYTDGASGHEFSGGDETLGQPYGGARLPTSRNLFTAKSAKPAKIILVAPK